MAEIIGTSRVPVNQGKLLENQLKKWQGGSHHPRGIAEYISNADDSYRRSKKMSGGEILVEIHSRSGKKIEKLIIQDYAEGMTFNDLENKFFQYFESFSGREAGEKVTGRFGTGGKAYAIMNFRHCWITSVRNGKECKAWFKWDSVNKEIIKGYNYGGYKDKSTDSANGTQIVLESSINVSHQFQDFVMQLEKLARIRHVLKSQHVIFRIVRKEVIEETVLKFSGPDNQSAKKIWNFILPESLRNTNGSSNDLLIRYFDKPIGENAFIDLTDSISSVADLIVKDYDGRPFSSYINGELTVERLLESTAVQENRRGLEEGDDLTEKIESFIRESVHSVVNEVEELQRASDREKRINAANEKLNELSKFLSKQDLKFKLEIKELKRRFTNSDEESFISDIHEREEENSEDDKDVYRKPVESDSPEMIIKGRWILRSQTESDNTEPKVSDMEFIPEETGNDYAVKVGRKKRASAQPKTERRGLRVLFSNDPSNHESPTFKEFDDPVSDRDMISKGIIWINAVHPIIVKFGNERVNDPVRDENIANFVLIVVAQYYTQKELELQPEDEHYDPLLLFRKHFFRLQVELRSDLEISYFEKN